MNHPVESIPHLPVLYHEVLDALRPESGKCYVDGTLGAGGHAEGVLLHSEPLGALLGLDLDPDALAISTNRLSPFGERVVIKQASYKHLPEILKDLGWLQVHGILLDLGVSSMQIDQPERGFSFQAEGPLDMRFDRGSGVSVADLINTLSEARLAQILWEYGEERFARRIARSIVATRPITTTTELADLVRKATPGKASRINPATRTFQALRIATNQELETLSQALPNLVSCLAPGGRIAVISFHSLEDRIVKQFFRRESQDCICPPEQPVCTCGHRASLSMISKKPIRPTQAEINENPRSSSARLRVAEKK